MKRGPYAEILRSLARRWGFWGLVAAGVAAAAVLRPGDRLDRGMLVLMTAAPAAVLAGPVAVLALVWFSSTAASTVPGFGRRHGRVVVGLAVAAVFPAAVPTWATTGHAVPALALSGFLVAGMMRLILADERERSRRVQILDGAASLLVLAGLAAAATGDRTGWTAAFFGGRSPVVTGGLVIGGVLLALDAARGAAASSRTRVATGRLPAAGLADAAADRELAERSGATVRGSWPEPFGDRWASTLAAGAAAVLLAAWLMIRGREPSLPAWDLKPSDLLWPLAGLAAIGSAAAGYLSLRGQANLLPVRVTLPPRRRRQLDGFFALLLLRQSALWVLPLVPPVLTAAGLAGPGEAHAFRLTTILRLLRRSRGRGPCRHRLGSPAPAIDVRRLGGRHHRDAGLACPACGFGARR